MDGTLRVLHLRATRSQALITSPIRCEPAPCAAQLTMADTPAVLPEPVAPLRHVDTVRSSGNLCIDDTAAEEAATKAEQRHCISEPASPRAGRPPSGTVMPGAAAVVVPTEAELSHFNEWSALLDMDAPLSTLNPCVSLVNPCRGISVSMCCYLEWHPFQTW